MHMHITDGYLQIPFTSIDVVSFRSVAESAVYTTVRTTGTNGHADVKKQVTIWVGVRKETVPTAAHDAAEEVLELLAKHSITDVAVEFRVSSVWP